MVKNRILYFLALVCALIFHSFFYEWFSEYLLLFLLILPVFSLLVSLPAIFTMHILANGPTEVPLGTNASIVLWTRCKLPQPRCKLSITVNNPLTEFSKRYKFRPDRLQLILPLPTDHCGTLHCKVTRCWVCDYLGLFCLPRRWNHSMCCHVLPTPIPLESMPSLEELQPQGFYPKAGGGMSEYHELREYQPGDNLRQIHWKLTAKLDTPIVREPQVPVFPTVVISPDLSVTASEIDTILGKTLYLSQFLLEHHIAHHVCWVSGNTTQEQSLERMEDLSSLTYSLIQSKKAQFSKENDTQTSIEEGGISYGFN